ncbi:hypothetical protein HO133_007385 [Letharia lupina]|uniref:N-acetyltransferase domain-containing protein n=1 Tax=Letharia lupina TaxID=560253 RepID=A0A8H6FIN5_9LECA|nr:uncharacterized protein HO133_007385 [Letharia lupina]KAF6229269.1 hypothetical protein HO133_007385 [Letharia lupina]
MEKKSNPAVTVESLPSISQASSSSSSAAAASAANHQVRVLHKSEYKEAALCLAEAFKDDDVVMYFVKTGDRKNFTAADEWKLHLHIMECITYAHIISGLATVVGPNYDCVALWMPPNKNMDDFCTMLWSGMFGLNWKLSKEGKKRFFDEFLPLLHDTKHHVLGNEDENSWYLVYIGTKPGSRGKGYAKCLIEHTTKQADVENRTSYLECSNVLNLNLYGRLGFRTVQQIRLLRGGKPIEMDVMTRVPVARQLVGKTAGFAGREGGK